MNRRDPRIQRTIDDLTTTFEAISTQTQTAAFSFTQEYINPCLESFSLCIDASCAPCVAWRRDRARIRRQRQHHSVGGRSNSRPEFVFDFYNDFWDDGYDDFDEGGADANERTGLLSGWGAEDLDRILAGSGSAEQHQQPRPNRGGMNYGARGVQGPVSTRRQRGETDPTLVPGSSMFGFLERLPWKIGGRGMRYRPSAADLQENLGRKDREDGARTEGDALLDDDEEWAEGDVAGLSSRRHGHRRQRSGTVKSTDTDNSLSSRGDLFPSDEEADAVVLDDEFAMALERRNTGDDSRSSKSKLARTLSGFTTASRSSKASRRKSRGSDAEGRPGSKVVSPSSDVKMTLHSRRKSDSEAVVDDNLPTIEQMGQEDEEAVGEGEVERKRGSIGGTITSQTLLSEEDLDTIQNPTEDTAAVEALESSMHGSIGTETSKEGDISSPPVTAKFPSALPGTESEERPDT